MEHKSLAVHSCCFQRRTHTSHSSLHERSKRDRRSSRSQQRAACCSCKRALPDLQRTRCSPLSVLHARAIAAAVTALLLQHTSGEVSEGGR